MPRYVVSLAVGGQYYVTDEHGMELDTLYDVQTKALRILEQTFPFAPDHLRSRCQIRITLPSGGTAVTTIPPTLASEEGQRKAADPTEHSRCG